MRDVETNFSGHTDSLCKVCSSLLLGHDAGAFGNASSEPTGKYGGSFPWKARRAPFRDLHPSPRPVAALDTPRRRPNTNLRQRPPSPAVSPARRRCFDSGLPLDHDRPMYLRRENGNLPPWRLIVAKVQTRKARRSMPLPEGIAPRTAWLRRRWKCRCRTWSEEMAGSLRRLRGQRKRKAKHKGGRELQ